MMRPLIIRITAPDYTLAWGTAMAIAERFYGEEREVELTYARVVAIDDAHWPVIGQTFNQFLCEFHA